MMNSAYKETHTSNMVHHQKELNSTRTADRAGDLFLFLKRYGVEDVITLKLRNLGYRRPLAESRKIQHTGKSGNCRSAKFAKSVKNGPLAESPKVVLRTYLIASCKPAGQSHLLPRTIIRSPKSTCSKPAGSQRGLP